MKRGVFNATRKQNARVENIEFTLAEKSSHVLLTV
jgi:hypothetical protein